MQEKEKGSKKEGISRKSFVKLVGTGAAAIAGTTLVQPLVAQTTPAKAGVPTKWDYEADVVVVGFGFAGQGAALEASDLGAKVIILDKAPRKHCGGSSLANINFDFCGIGPDVETAITYLKSELWGSVDDENVIRDHVIGNHELPSWIERLGGRVVWSDNVPSYLTLPGAKEWGTNAAGKSRFVGYPPKSYEERQLKGEIPSGWQEWMNDLVSARGIPIMCDTPATELIQDPTTGEILGLRALKGVTTSTLFKYSGGTPITVKAKKGVILATGGYENNKEMIKNWAPHPHGAFVTFYGSPYSTGDGVTMATKVGAKLWHLNKTETHAFASTLASKELGCGRTVKAWATSIAMGPGIIVNAEGQRFHNEYHWSGHSDDRREWNRFEHKQMPADDYNYANYRHVPMYWIFDDTTMKAGALGNTTQFAGVLDIWKWTKDNKAELAKGWFIAADTVEALAKKLVIKDFHGRVIGMDAAGLSATIQKYNYYCASGKDLDFGRRPSTMTPLLKPPFYAMEICECQTNTQGGPKHDRYMQILDSYDKPIPRLYEAGEMGSIFGHLYNGGENIPEAASGGRRAARHAVSLKAWS